MPTLKIVIYPDPVLSQPAKPVNKITSIHEKLLDDMAKTMYQHEGVGLAANQVGVLERVAVIDVSDDRNELIELINPEIITRTGKISSREGCLSIPGYRESVQRSKEVTVKALDRNGKEFTLEATGILSYCLQHEIDHLDGVLFVDHFSRIKKGFFKKWAEKHL